MSPRDRRRKWRTLFRRPTRRERFVFYGIGIALCLIGNVWVAGRAIAVHRQRVPYSPFFLNQVSDGNVVKITSHGTAIQGELRKPSKDSSGRHVRSFATEIPAFADTQQLARLLQRRNVLVNAEPLQSNAPWWLSLLLGVGPTILLLVLLVWLFRRMASPARMFSSFGGSQALRYAAGDTKVTFADVAGIDDAKEELAEIVDFLRNPTKYDRLGGRVPRGVLLSGAPGTGKTLLARAVAAEAGVPFFSMSASEFVEAVVGIGASRVRSLFKQAKEAAPAIVFIDELDAIGRARDNSSVAGAGQEREQTLNQILTEMDGFDPSATVIVIAATNRPDILDKALLRPGRFDRRVTVQPPDRAGRRLILDVHVRNVRLASDVDLDTLAATTSGMVGADLANLVNEAALTAARRNHDAVTSDDLAVSLEKVLLGAERRLILSDGDKRRTAYHEAGHALAGMIVPGADPVRKISIIPRGSALGVTLAAPDVDRFSYTDYELAAAARVLLAGRAAEELVLGDIATTAEADLERLTRLARQMIGRWGMSDRVGLMTVIPNGLRVDDGEVSPYTLALVDSEVRRIADEAYADVSNLLRTERWRLDALADALLTRETLDAAEAYAIAGVERQASVVGGTLTGVDASRLRDPGT